MHEFHCECYTKKTSIKSLYVRWAKTLRAIYHVYADDTHISVPVRLVYNPLTAMLVKCEAISLDQNILLL